MRKRILFEAGKENITGTIIGTNTEKKSDFIFLHGAGKSTKEKAHGFFDTLLFKTIPNITTFDFSGHGESSGTLKKSSLQKRIFETKTAIDLYTTKSQLTVCGTSMGGYIALTMLDYYNVKNLILFAPAVYNDEALALPFDAGFTEAIRKPKSWQKSSVLQSLENFTGNLLLVIGTQDEVIPKDVIALIDLQ